jgi:hypothetical protein
MRLVFVRHWLAAGLVLTTLTVSTPAQTPDRFQSAPGPAAPQPRPHVPLPPEPVPIPSTENYQGTWAGSYTCGPTPNGNAGFVHQMQATVRANQVELNWGIPGAIGSQHSVGTVDANGSVRLVGEGISGIPGKGYGTHYVIELSGRFDGQRFSGHGTHGERSCELVFTRTNR